MSIAVSRKVYGCNRPLFSMMNSFFNKMCSVNGLIPKIVEFDGKEFVDTIVSVSLLLVVVHHDWRNLVRTYGGHNHSKKKIIRSTLQP